MPAGRPSFDPTINYYDVLDVPYTATKEEITRSYRSLIRDAHPDRFPDEMDRRKAEERAKLLNAAYSVLARPETRREYDHLIRQRVVNDALFQRYTGNVPGQQAAFRTARRTMSPEMARAQRVAGRSAFTHFIIVVIIFVAALAVLVVLGSLAFQGLAAVFS